MNLIGAELDAAVGRALGLDVEIDGSRCIRNLSFDPVIGAGDFVGYSPSTDWSQGGPIIERERIMLTSYVNGDWEAFALAPDRVAERVAKGGRRGPTPLIAAMRAFVASKEQK